MPARNGLGPPHADERSDRLALLGEDLSWATVAGFGLIIRGAMVVTGNLAVRKPRRA